MAHKPQLRGGSGQLEIPPIDVIYLERVGGYDGAVIGGTGVGGNQPRWLDVEKRGPMRSCQEWAVDGWARVAQVRDGSLSPELALADEG